MPFALLYGLPETHESQLLALRRGIVYLLTEEMHVPMDWVRPIAPVDAFSEPTAVLDGAKTIVIILETAMFFNKLDAEQLAQKVTKALAQFVWQFYGGLYEVECFVHNLDPEWKSLIKAGISS